MIEIDIENFENSLDEINQIILIMAQHIEVSGLSYSGSGKYWKGEQGLTKTDWWNLLTPEQKYERILQARGGWNGIQEVGVQKTFNMAFQSYVDEK